MLTSPGRLFTLALTLAFALTLTTPAPSAHAALTTYTATTKVAGGASWQYLNSASAAPAGWNTAAFSASTWRSGPSPLGMDDSTKPATAIGTAQRTAYLRTTFNVATLTSAKSVRMEVAIDDGAVIYLNGVEVSRINMPSGTVGYNTSALTAVDVSAESGRTTIQLPTSRLKVGTNVLAIELHSYFTSTWISPDSWMDATLAIAYTGTPYPGLSLAFNDGFTTGALDTTKWRAENDSLYGSADGLLNCFQANNVRVASGIASLNVRRETVSCGTTTTATKHFTSGFISSRQAGRYFPLYGKFEARLRIPHGQGLWPTFWLRHREGSDVGEVDLMESFHASRPGRVSQTLHFPNTLSRNVARSYPVIETPTKGVGDWHTYAVDIAPVPGTGESQIRFVWTIDGFETLSYTLKHAATVAALKAGDRQASWDIAMGMNVGGRHAGSPDAQLGYYPMLGVCAQTYKAPLNKDPRTCPTTGTWLAPWAAAPRMEIEYARYYKPLA
ncbi:MAG: glycoside hydrolase family 16 protein [Micropruina sp.]